MNSTLRELIDWRIKGVIIAFELREQKRLKVARLITQATEALEDYIQEEFENEYVETLFALIQEREAKPKASETAEIVPICQGKRP